jgi:hypothetical protein
MAHDVFISHANQDKSIADAVCAGLEHHGIRCWIAPRDIRPGADWGQSIVEGIRRSRVLVLVFTSRANTSHHIPREIEQAVKNGIAVIPLRVEDALPEGSLEYNLSSVHWLDAMTPPLEAHIKRLADTVSVILEESTTTADAQDSLRANSPSFAAQSSEPVLGPQKRVPHRLVPLVALVGIIFTVVLAIWFWPPINHVAVPSPSLEPKQNSVVQPNPAATPGPLPVEPKPTPIARPAATRGSPSKVPPEQPSARETNTARISESLPTSSQDTSPGGNSPIVGCWAIGPGRLVIRSNGTFVSDGTLTGPWEMADAARHLYFLHFPEMQVYAELSSDGRILNQTGQITFTFTRDSPGVDIAGSWHFSNGNILSVRSDGTFTAGSLAGTWRLTNAERRSYVLTWPGPLEAATLAADNQHLSISELRYGFSVALQRCTAQ